MSDGERISVAAVAVDQAARADKYSQPPAGQHYVAVKFLLHNTGTTVYDDAVDNCVKVGDSGGKSYRITIVEKVSSGPVIDLVKIAPGKSDSGWSVFAVPNGQKIVSVSYDPDSGETAGGSWNV